MNIRISALLLIVSVSASSCRDECDCTNVYSDLIDNYKTGNYSEFSILADSIKQNCQCDENIVRVTDSLLQISERIKLDFTLSESEFRIKAQKLMDEVSDSLLGGWEKRKWLEWMMIDGEKKYFSRAASNLRLLYLFYDQNDKLLELEAADPARILRREHTAEVIRRSEGDGTPALPVKMKIKYTITVNPDAVPAGDTIRCWLPYPRLDHLRQTDVELLETSQEKFLIAPDSAVHKTLYMETVAQGEVASTFSITYNYTSYAQYFDPGAIIVKPYDKASELYLENTSEQLPQINSGEKIRHLTDSLTSGITDPVTIARVIYLWFKENVPWTGALEYSIMPDIPDYVFTNRRGDCGMQTFLFMSMLRYKGIPVRWQSGWMVPPIGKNLHDWCEVYIEGTGWIPVDISYDLQQSDDIQVKEFFLSGIDSYRLIINNGISGQLFPPKKFLRSEPFDFQRGEVEWKNGNLYFDKWDYKTEIEYLK
jgi:hypothetical protein